MILSSKVLGLACCFLCLQSVGQEVSNTFEKSDSLLMEMSVGFVSSGQNGFLPFYLVSNQFGEIKEDQNLFVKGALNYDYKFFEKFKATTGFSFRNDILSSYFVKFNLGNFFLSAGRLRESVGGNSNGLSSGSLGISQNARPVPMISAGLTDYTNIPLTGGYLKFKGDIRHGWFEKNRVIANAQLHSKSFYVILDLDKHIGFKASSGLVHFAQFGGVANGTEQLPDSFSDFLKVFKGGGASGEGVGTEGENNGLGNHLGIVDTKVEKTFGKHKLTLNYQKPFEDEGSLQYISLTDYLLGAEWDFGKSSSWLNKVYIEILQTRWQSGPGIPDPTEDIQTIEDNQGYFFGQRDDTYNNFLYRSGWTYHGQVIGNPLFLTYQRTLNFFDVYPDYEVAIANNRIWAFHSGFDGFIKSNLSYKVLFTYSRNSGTYAGLYEGRFSWEGVRTDPDFEYVFLPVQEQFYSSVYLKYEINKLPMAIELRLAHDFGDLYQLFGGELSFKYVIAK